MRINVAEVNESLWRQRFAIFPRKTREGEIVFFEKVWERKIKTFNNDWFMEFSSQKEKPMEWDEEMKRRGTPPAPSRW